MGRPGAGGGEPGLIRAAPAVGDELGQELERALGLCFRELDRRDRTEVQVRARLERGGTGAATIDAAVAWLTERRYIDDAGYAERFAADRRRLDGWGSERIRRRLESAGVAPEVIATAVDGRGEPEELEAAVAVLEARMTGASGAAKDRRRAVGLLVRRGYAVELAEEAVGRHFGPVAGLDD